MPSQNHPESNPSPDSRSRAGMFVWLVLLLFAVAMSVLIARDAFPNSRAAQDQDNYHLRAVRQFAAEFPTFNFKDYRSATTPGYHVVLATVAKVISDDARTVRFAGLAFSLALIAVVGSSLRSSAGGLLGALLVAPLAASLYTVSSAAWILPDNAGWLGVAAIVALVLLRRPTAPGIVGAGAMLLALTLCRQTHVWCAALIWAWPLLSDPVRPGDSEHKRPIEPRPKLLAVAILATLPAFAAILYFKSQWGGLVPPLFQGGVMDPILNRVSPKNSGGNPATPAFVLTLCAIFGVFFTGFLIPGIRRLLRADRVAIAFVALGIVIGLMSSLAVATSFSPEAGRYTGFWAIAQKLPSLHDRSLFILAGAAAGGAVLGLWALVLKPRDAILLAGALLAFTAAQSAAFAAWQRYTEPMVLLLLAFAACRVSPSHSGRSGVIGLILLTLVQVAITARFIAGGG